jgi:hypothetical protein
MFTRLALIAIMLATLVCPRPAAAQPALDCAKPVQQAQQAIDKVTEDMKGMEKMPKEQLVQIHALLDDAKMQLDGARHNCDKPRADYDLARAVAKAEAARGSADAADMLHWHYMKGMSGMMGGGTSMPGSTSGGTHDMSGMKK